MNNAARVLFAVSEATPFIATGGLGDVGGSLPRALREAGADARVILPLYGEIGQQYRDRMSFLGSQQVRLAWRNQYCGVYTLKQDGVPFYFIDNEYYYKRSGLYGHYDDGERFAFFCRAVLDCLPLTAFAPQIIHSNDWQTALLPVYLSLENKEVKTVFTVHNVEYQGRFDREIMGDVFGLPEEALGLLDYDGSINLMKGAVECADQVTTVSPTYAGELRDPAYAHGLDHIFELNKGKLRGILNGIDRDRYNPADDPALLYTYNEETLDKKLKNKLELQQTCSLRTDSNTPLLAVISRLAEHKGMDLLCGAAERIMERPVQLLILGKGEERFEDCFSALANRFPGKTAAMIEFSSNLARKVYAGADVLLMPSKSEPCGLAQMIACRYGTVPVVRKTGGLADSISDCSLGKGSGFVFSEYTPEALIHAIDRALKVYSNRDDWQKLSRFIMELDFGWERSAKEYLEIYQQLL